MSRIVPLLLMIFVSGVVFAAPVRQLRERVEMNFSIVVPDPTGDVIILSPSGVLSSNNFSFFIGSAEAARFTARGDQNAAAAISFSASDVMIGPGANMTLSNFTHDAGETPFFDASGNIEFNVGGSLTVSANQSSGSYSGSYTVFVDYP